MSPRITFDSELKRLQEDIEEIGMAVQALYVKVFFALSEKKQDELKEIVKSDRDIHAMQRSIESSCLNLITKQQPVARDLRQVTAALKMVNDISRIGDQCADIAELLLRMNMKDLSGFSVHLSDMIVRTKEQLSEVIDSFMQKDTTAAVGVIEKDDLVDDLFNLVKLDLICHLKEDGKDPDDCIDVLMIAKHIEKVGDHAVNMAQWTIFRETGEIKNVRLL